jgi:hypothetical protein
MAALAPPGQRTTKTPEHKRSQVGKRQPRPVTLPALVASDQALQTKLTVSEPDDQLENEADRVAQHVMRMRAPSVAQAGEDDDASQNAAFKIHRSPLPEAHEDDDVQRKCDECNDEDQVQRQGDFFDQPPPQPLEEEEEAPAVQAKGARARRSRKRGGSPPHDFPARLAAARRGGEEIPTPLRHFMEARFQHGFQRVRVHHDAAASKLASSIQARAFTVGQHVFFNQGEFQPHTQQGRSLVAHELTHVLQQRGRLHSVQREVMERTEAAQVTEPDTAHERAAEQLSFEQLSKLFGWREQALPPLVFEALRSLMTRALNVVAFRESLAILALDEAGASVRRFVRSPSRELTLELQKPSDTAPVATRWELEFLDGARPKASGGGDVTIHTDEDTIAVRDATGSKPPPVPAAEAPLPQASTLPATDTTAAPQPAPSAAEPAAPAAVANEAGAASAQAAPAPLAEPAPVTPTAEEGFFPSSPEQDPSFQAVTASAGSAAAKTSEHSEGSALAANAKDAAQVAPGEQLSQAQSNKADQLQAAKTPAFDRAAFVKAVLDKVRATAPGTLEQAGSFARDHKAGLEKSVGQAATTQTDNTSGELKTLTDAAPNTSAVPPRTTAEFTPEAVGAPPADIRAERAVPPERPESQVEGAIDANQQAAQARLDELGFTNAEETFAKSNDPEMLGTLDAKHGFDADAAAAPVAFREGEQAMRADAMNDAGALGQQKLGAMFASRSQAVGQVAAGQLGGKTSVETKRAAVVAEVNRIFTSTETKVKARLTTLKQTVSSTFKTESQRALDTFTSRVVSAEKRWEERAFLDQAADKIGSAILGIPTELEADLQATRDAFIREMTEIVERLAVTVETELNAAKGDISAGRAELKKFLDGLEPSLATLKGRLSAEFSGKFGTLETQVQNAQAGLVTGLAEQFKARLDESNRLLTEVRERNRDVFDVLADGIKTVRDKTIGLLEKMQAVFQDGVDTLMRVLDDPITFAANFLAGIAQGVQGFAANIGKHLKAGLIEWLTGSVAGAGVTLPTSLDVKGIVGFILQLLGLTVDNVKARARVIWGEKIVRAIELGVEGAQKAIELFNILQTEGVGGLFNYLKEKFVEFKDAALQKIRDAIGLELVEAAVKKIASLLIPGGAFLQAVLSIVDTVFFFIRNADRLADLVQTVISAVKDILAGNVGALAAKVEAVMASTIPVVLDFLATLIGIGGKITEIIQKALKSVTQPIQDAIDAVLLAIKKAVGGFIDRILGKGGAKGGAEAAAEVAPGTPMTTEQIIAAVVPTLSEPTKSTDPAEALAEKKAQAEELKRKFQPSAPEGKTLKITFIDRSTEQVADDREVDMEVGFSPGTPATAKVGKDELPPTNVIPGGVGAAGALGPVIADPLTEKPGNTRGRPPGSASPGSWSLLRQARRVSDGASVYVRGHLLNQNLHGPNDIWNLVPLTRSLNSTHEAQAESKIKKHVLENHGIARYEISLDYSSPPDRDGKPPTNAALLAAEQQLPRAISLKAVELDRHPSGGFKPGKILVSTTLKHTLEDTDI